MQQRFAEAQTQHIPDDIARLAHEQHLGTPQAGYTIIKLRRYWRWSQYALPAVFLPFLIEFIVLFLLDTTFSTATYLLLLGGFYLLFTIWMLALRFTQRMCPLYTCNEGLILKQSLVKFQIVRWDEIETIWYSPARTMAGFWRKRRLYLIHSQDGSTMTLTGHRKTLEKLDAVLEREFTRRRLPFQLADFRAGQMLSFGPLSIDAQGVHALDHLLPWAQVAGFVLEKDQRLVISQLGDPPQKWQSFPIQKIPNLSMLLALVQRVRSGQSEQEAGLQMLAAYGGPTVIVQSGSRIDPLPEGLAALAGEQQLGERRLDQYLGRSRFASWVAIITLVIFEALCIVFEVVALKSFLAPSGIVDTSSYLYTFVIYGFPLLAFITLGLIHQLQQIHTCTYTFEHGMVFQRAGRTPVVFRWEEVEVVWRKPNFFSVQQNQSAYAYTLQLRDGTKHTFTRLNIKQQALSKIVQEQIVPLQLPAVIAAYQAGQVITFGPAQLSQQGIALSGRVLPWSQVRSVTLQGNRLAVFDLARRKPWGKLDAKHVPNLFLLFALADYARTGPLSGDAS